MDVSSIIILRGRGRRVSELTTVTTYDFIVFVNPMSEGVAKVAFEIGIGLGLVIMMCLSYHANTRQIGLDNWGNINT